MRLSGRPLLLLALVGSLACAPARTRTTHPLDKPLPPRDSAAGSSSVGSDAAQAESSAVRSYVILLPDENGGSSGELKVSSGGEVVTLDAPNQGIFLDGTEGSFTADGDQLAPFGQALAAEPPAPMRFEILFDSDAARPTKEALARVQSEIDQLKRWPVPEIVIVGHADRAGTEDHNLRLSRRRAEEVRLLIAKLGVESATLRVEALGESTPAWVTPDGVADLRNRRVEVSIR